MEADDPTIGYTRFTPDDTHQGLSVSWTSSSTYTDAAMNHVLDCANLAASIGTLNLFTVKANDIGIIQSIHPEYTVTSRYEALIKANLA